MPEVVASVLASQREQILGSQSLIDFNNTWIESPAGKTLSGAGAAASVQNLITKDDKDSIAIILGKNWKTQKDEQVEYVKRWITGEIASTSATTTSSCSPDKISPKAITFPIRKAHDDCIVIYKQLKSELRSEEAAAMFLEACAQIFENSSFFSGHKHVERMREIQEIKAAEKETLV